LKKKTFRLRNPKYYRRVFLEIKKFMEVGEKYMEVEEETVGKEKEKAQNLNKIEEAMHPQT